MKKLSIFVAVLSLLTISSLFAGTWLNYDGDDRFVTFPYYEELTIEDGDFSWVANVKTDGQGNFESFLIFHNREDNVYHDGNYVGFVIEANTGFAKFRFYDGNEEKTVWGETDIQDNEWHQVAATRSGNTLSVFVDGELDGTESFNDIQGVENQYGYRIGARINPGGDPWRQAFDGSIDEVSIWDTVLSAGDLQDLIGNRPEPDADNLIAYWTFDEGEGQTVNDMTDNDIDGYLGFTGQEDANDPEWFTELDVEVTSPDGGEEYEISELATLTWETEGDVVETKVYYSIDGGDWVLITDQLTDETETEWRVPPTLTDECLIKVVVFDDDEERVEDSSDNFFSIIQPTKWKTFGAGWSLISLPLTADDMSVNAVLRDDLDQQAAVYGFTPELGMYIPDELEIGMGYFVGTPSENIVDITGMPNLDDSYTFQLNRGWNLIGGPFRFITELNESDVTLTVDEEEITISWDDAVDEEYVTPVMFNYFHNEGQEEEGHIFFEKQRFHPWYGYWYLVMEDCALTVYTPLPYPSPERDYDYSVDNWHTQILVSSDGQLDDCRLGVYDLATDGFDNAYDYPEPPSYLIPFENPVRAYFVEDEWNETIGSQYNRDIRNPLERGETGEWTFTVQPSSDSEVTLRWPNVATTAPYGDGVWYDFYLVDAVNDQMINMRTEDSYSYNPDGEQQFAVRVVSALSADDRGAEQPTNFGLTAVYPNPFNSTATISYALPTSSDVTLSVYNQSGQLVTELFSGSQSAGNYSASWNGMDSPSGIYFVKMQAGGFSDISKLTLVK